MKKRHVREWRVHWIFSTSIVDQVLQEFNSIYKKYNTSLKAPHDGVLLLYM